MQGLEPAPDGGAHPPPSEVPPLELPEPELPPLPDPPSGTAPELPPLEPPELDPPELDPELDPELPLELVPELLPLLDPPPELLLEQPSSHPIPAHATASAAHIPIVLRIVELLPAGLVAHFGQSNDLARIASMAISSPSLMGQALRFEPGEKAA